MAAKESKIRCTSPLRAAWILCLMVASRSEDRIVIVVVLGDELSRIDNANRWIARDFEVGSNGVVVIAVTGKDDVRLTDADS